MGFRGRFQWLPSTDISRCPGDVTVVVIIVIFRGNYLPTLTKSRLRFLIHEQLNFNPFSPSLDNQPVFRRLTSYTVDGDCFVSSKQNFSTLVDLDRNRRYSLYDPFLTASPTPASRHRLHISSQLLQIESHTNKLPAYASITKNAVEGCCSPLSSASSLQVDQTCKA